MRNKSCRTVLIGLCAAILAAPALAAATDIVKSRIAGFREVGAAFKNVNDELKSSTPQMMILQISAREIRNASSQQYGWFPAGSGPQPGRVTKAKPEIWTRAAQFKAAQDGFAVQANAFVQAAASRDVERMRVQARSLGQACATCHRTFRVEERR